MRRDDSDDLWYQPDLDVFLNRWFSNYDEARRSLRGWLQALSDVSGGMAPKLAACVDAIGKGVEAAHIIDGRRPHSLLIELFTDAGIGTKIRAGT